MKFFIEDLSAGLGGGFLIGIGGVWARKPKLSIVFWRWEIGIRAAAR